MIIGVDCDNVLNNLTESVLKVYNEDYNDNLTPNDITDYYIENFVKPEYKDNFYKLFTDKRVWKGISVIDGCADVLKKWNDLGHTIYIVTSTEPANILKKANWLQRTLPFLNIRKRLICIQKKQLLSEIDVLIDDCYDNLIGGKYSKIVLDYPWNRNYDDDKHFVRRCKDWSEIDERLEWIFELKFKSKG